MYAERDASSQQPRGGAETQASLQELVRRAQARDQSAFAALYEHYSPKIRSYLYYHLNGHAAEAEDLTNEVFVKVLEKIHAYEFRGLPFSAWLYRIAHNHLVDHVRSRPKQQPVPIEVCQEMHEEGAQRELENALTAEDLKAALVDLTEEQRQVIILRFVQGLNTIETAAIMGKSEGAVKKLQARGLLMLKKILSEGRAHGRH